MHIKAVMFDFIGTTIVEKDSSILNQCFVAAFKDHGVEAEINVIKKHRGKEKREMIKEILAHYHLSTNPIDPILESFRTQLQNNLDNFRLNDGANEVLHFLKNQKIMIGIGTGLPRDIFDAILDHVGWNTNQFDYIGIADEIGKGRPDPQMLVDMMYKLSLRRVELLKIGDTVADIQEGKNAGVMTVAIISGTQNDKELISQRPEFIIRSLMEIERIISLS